MNTSQLTVDDFREDNRVILIPGNFSPRADRPVYGSDFESIGTVAGIHHTPNYLTIVWDNGIRERFHPSYIDHYTFKYKYDCTAAKLSKSNPNQVFRRRKRDRSKEVKTAPAAKLRVSGLSYEEWKKKNGIS